MNSDAVAHIERITGYRFKDTGLVEIALTHASYSDNRINSNERLEFLGDAVLSLVVCHQLFEKFPLDFEGDLTKMKSTIVSRKVCAEVARCLDLGKHARLGKGLTNRRALSGSVSACLLEAIIAVLYIDGGLEAARCFILNTFADHMDKASDENGRGNFKSLIQQYAQRQMGTSVKYELLDEKGPDHDKCFESQAVISGRRFRGAWGMNKKESEQRAAFEALLELGILNGDAENGGAASQGDQTGDQKQNEGGAGDKQHD